MRILGKVIIFALTLAALPFGVSPVEAQLWDSNLWDGAPAAQPTVRSERGGFYLGIQGGMNAYQSYDGVTQEVPGIPGVDVRLGGRLGGYGGVKWGYAFSDGARFSSAIEADIFYNGMDFDADVRGHGPGRGGGEKFFGTSGRFNTGAAMVNYIYRYGEGRNFRPFVGAGRFQPYVGAGIGLWFGESSVDAPGGLSISDNGSGFAWQLIAGADYFVSSEMSFFAEYKFLNYNGVDFTDDSVYQHLVGVGLRFYF